MKDIEPGETFPATLLVVLAEVLSKCEASWTILNQAQSARVTSYSPTMVDVIVPEDRPVSSLPDGPTPGHALVVDATGELIGEVLVWIRGGRLIGLEQAWFTEYPPATWPEPSQIRLQP